MYTTSHLYYLRDKLKRLKATYQLVKDDWEFMAEQYTLDHAGGEEQEAYKKLESATANVEEICRQIRENS